LKSSITLLIVFYFSAFEICSVAQTGDIAASSRKFMDLYNSGDIINADKCLLQVLDSGYTIPKNYEFFIYNNLGVTSSFLGRYKNALNYYNLAERSILTLDDSSYDLGDIYVNKAIIYGYQKSYAVAIDFFEKGIRIYQNSIGKGKGSYLNMSKAYLNLGIIYYEIQDYDLALNYLNKSRNIKEKMHLSGLGLTYLNLAKTYVKTGNQLKAEEFYNKSIESFIDDFNSDYFRLAEVYFDYGLFLREEGKYSEALEVHKRALSICLKNYGNKHTLVSLSYKHLGDHYTNLEKYDSALFYYQKSLIAIVPDFNDTDIFNNPLIDSSLFDIRLLDNLKSKSRALRLLAGSREETGEKLNTLNKSLETIDLALGLIDNIRNNYPTEESRLYLAENEKETYSFAIHLAHEIYLLEGGEIMKQKIYDIARKAKSAVLQDEISGNDIMFNAGIPDSLLNRGNNLSGMISAYSNLIQDELLKSTPDSAKITLWKDAVFEMNNEKDKVTDLINTRFPRYHELLSKTEPMPLSEIRKKLSKKEAIIDYFLCNQTSGNKRDLYIFIITRDRLEFHEQTIDSLFVPTIALIRNSIKPAYLVAERKMFNRDRLDGLYYVYKSLIMPIVEYLPGNKLIIIPDEEISWVSFDALLFSRPQPEVTDYEGLDYLINNYSISYGYSSSLIFGNSKPGKGGKKLLSFAPDYVNNQPDAGQPAGLPGAGKEIESIYKWFRGQKYSGNTATETNFRKAMKTPALLHLAMHSVTDTVNSKYSYLLFSESADSVNDGRLYNYEISLERIASPMVVLSACNSGTGTLYHGEGVMSLARSFILAGASSVIKTSWEVNDEVSAAIITQFYYYLSKGKAKDEAMRLAKLDFMKSIPPSLSNPYYWAAYEVLGDNGPVVKSRYKLLIPVIIVLFACGAGLFYFRRRRISAERSW
jgi:CHAT domain-containing protein/tetratricopeptide (TPR) repeat protein